MPGHQAIALNISVDEARLLPVKCPLCGFVLFRIAAESYLRER
jgi:hypothetical protein